MSLCECSRFVCCLSSYDGSASGSRLRVDEIHVSRSLLPMLLHSIAV